MSFELIQKKIELLKKQDSSFKIFGASSHRYIARPVATTQQVADFEGEHGIILPQEYRDFITEIGNGGVGPYYGIAGLGDHQYLESRELAPDLRISLPHLSGWNLPDTFFEKWSDLQEKEDNAAIEEMEIDYWGPQRVPGSMEICDYGCASRFLLIVSGEERDNIWFDRRADWEGLKPVQLEERPNCKDWMSSISTSHRRTTLRGWVERWLDHSLALVMA